VFSFNYEDYFFLTERGGRGGSGARGGVGGDGGPGGRGGPGGGGAAGTVKLVGTLVDSRASVNVSGGRAGGPGGSAGHPGRFVIGSHGSGGAFLGSLIGPDQPEIYPGSTESNPLTGRQHATPFIPGLPDGAEIYGLLQLSVPITQDVPQLLAAPAGASAALIRLDRGPTGCDDDFNGYDMVLLVNLDGTPLLNPALRLGRLASPTAIQQRGVSRNPEFGGGGAIPLDVFDVGGVYATLVPDITLDAAVAFDHPGGHFDAVVGNLTVDQPLFLVPTNPSNEKRIFGLARGGTISLTVGTVTIDIQTLAGQTPEEIAARLAAEINANAQLKAMGIVAYVDGARLVFNGNDVQWSLDDPGLNDVGCDTPPTPWIDSVVVNTCPETTVLMDAGSHSTYQWYYNDTEIEGADRATLNATLDGLYSVRVQGNDGCLGYSSSTPAVLEFCPESELSPPGAIFPLRVEASSQADSGRYIYFQRLAGATVEEVNIYYGAIGDWYSHAGDAHCNVAWFEDLGTGEMRIDETLPPGDIYFLVTATSGGVESRSHTASNGLPSDLAQEVCLP
jgi:hypothetical protein